MSEFVPEGWCYSTFGEVTNIIKSGLSRRISSQDIGIPVIISGNIKDNRFDTSEFKYWYLDDPQGADTNRYILNNDDLLLCFINSLSQIGKVCVFKDIGRPAIYTTNLFRIVIDVKHDSTFIYNLMTGKVFQEEIQLITKPAVNQASFTKSDLELIRVLLPPLPEQQKIAAILTSVDEVIENTQAQINKLKDLKTGMMQELLTRGVGVDGKPHTEFKDSPVGRIPKGWEVVTTGQVTKSIVPGRNKPKDLLGDIPWLTISDLDSFYVDKSKFNYGVTRNILSDAKGKTLPKNTVIMSVVGEFGVSSVARVEVVINQQLHGFVCSKQIDSSFLCLSLRYHKAQMEQLATQTTIAYMNKNNAESVLIALPSILEQRYIASSIMSIEKKINSISQSLLARKNTKKALMQDLLTGKVRVKVDS